MRRVPVSVEHSDGVRVRVGDPDSERKRDALSERLRHRVVYTECICDALAELYFERLAL